MSIITFLSPPSNATEVFLAVASNDLSRLKSSNWKKHPQLNQPVIITQENTNNKDLHGDWSPVLLACALDSLETVILLVENGADVNWVSQKTGASCLHLARSTQLVEFLLSHKAKVSVKNNMGQSPLFSAVQRGHLASIERLIKAGADVNEQDQTNNFPLFVAVQHRFFKVVELLLMTEGVNINMKGQNGLTPLALARMNKDTSDIAKLLLLNGADSTEPDLQKQLDTTQLAQSNEAETIRKLKLQEDWKQQVQTQELLIRELNEENKTMKSNQQVLSNKLDSALAALTAAVEENKTIKSNQQVLSNKLVKTEAALAALNQTNIELKDELAKASETIKQLQQQQLLANNNNSNSGNKAGASLPKFSTQTIEAATNHFSQGNKLGSGAFGVVYKGSYLHISIAVKKLRVNRSQDIQFQAELASLSRFRHPNIIGILGYSEEDDNKWLVYELAPNGSLRDRLDRKNGTPTLTWPQRENIAKGITLGMLYLQDVDPKSPFFHLDLKSDNVLLDSNFQPKIADFGLAKPVVFPHGAQGSNVYVRAQPVGDRNYICPEYLHYGRVSRKTDVYSYGCILAELLTGQKSSTKLMEIVREASIKGTLNDKLDKTLGLTDKELLNVGIISQICVQCIQTSRLERPGFPKIVTALSERSEIAAEDAAEAIGTECNICSEAPIDCVLKPCNHAVMCQGCAVRWISEGNACPVCQIVAIQSISI